MFSNLLNIIIYFENYLETQHLHHDTLMNYYSHASLGNILRRVRPVWSHKMPKTSPRFEKCSGLWHDFSAYEQLEKKVFGPGTGIP